MLETGRFGGSPDQVPVTPENVGMQIEHLVNRGPIDRPEGEKLHKVLDKKGPEAARKAMGDTLQPYLDAEDERRKRDDI